MIFFFFAILFYSTFYMCALLCSWWNIASYKVLFLSVPSHYFQWIMVFLIIELYSNILKILRQFFSLLYQLSWFRNFLNLWNFFLVLEIYRIFKMKLHWQKITKFFVTDFTQTDLFDIDKLANFNISPGKVCNFSFLTSKS